MDKVNANDFRSNLKKWLEAASVEPIKITRKSGDSFILLKFEDFENIQIELANLRGLSQGLSDVIQGRTKKSNSKSTEDLIKRAKERVFGKRNKKAVG